MPSHISPLAAGKVHPEKTIIRKVFIKARRLHADPYEGTTMPNTLLFPIALVLASLLLSGCMKLPDDNPLLAASTTLVGASQT